MSDITTFQLLEGSAAFDRAEPPVITHYTFTLHGDVTGTLRVKNGQLTFEGDADASAKQFFETVIQAHSDAYTAGFEACREMAVDEMVKAAPKYGPEGPDSAEAYGEDQGFGACVQIVRALQPQQKDSSDE